MTERPRGRVRSAAVWTVVLAVAVLAPGWASARQGPDARVDELVERAIDDYGALELPAAEEKLERAIEIAGEQDVSDAVLARAVVMWGVVQFGQSRDVETVREAFVRALKFDPEADIRPVVATPKLKEIMAEAREQVDSSSSGEEAADPQIRHEPVSSTRAGEPLTVRAAVPTGVDQVDRVVLFYRRYGRESYERVAFERNAETSFRAELGAEEVRTSQIAYFIVAVSPNDDVVASSGSRSDPYEVTVFGSDVPGDGEDPGSEEATEESEASDEGSDEADDRSVIQGGFVQVAGGTGVGLLTGGRPTANPDWPWNPGLAPALGHLVLDGGVEFSGRSSLGLYFQWQFSPAQDFDKIRREEPSRELSGLADGACLGTGLPGDCLLGLKYRYWLDRSGPVHFSSSLGAGVGRSRHLLRLKDGDVAGFCEPNGKQVRGSGDRRYCFRIDTVRPGPVHFGVGGGVSWELTDFLSLVAEGYLAAFFPENTALNLDVHAGPMFTF